MASWPSSLSARSSHERSADVGPATIVRFATPGNLVMIATGAAHEPVACSVSVRALTSYLSPSSRPINWVVSVSYAIVCSANPVAELSHADSPVSRIWRRTSP